MPAPGKMQPNKLQALEGNLNYHRHLQRLKKAHCEVDDSSPEINTISFIYNLQNDVETVLQRTTQNFTALGMIMQHTIVGGAMNTFRKPNQFPDMSKLKTYQKVIMQVEKINRRFGKRLTYVKPVIRTGLKKGKKKESKDKSCTPIKYENAEDLINMLQKLKIDLPRDPKIIESIMRPKIYYDIRVGNSPRLERLVIQLYLEAAPQIVRDMLMMCESKSYERFSILRLFVDLWIEFELLLNKSSMSSTKLEYDDKVLDINQVGLLLFHRMFIEGFQVGLINFVINFRSIKVLHETHIPFGRIVSNFAFLNRLQEFGTRRGKPKKQLVIADCGVLK